MRSTLLLRLESVSTQLSLSALDLWNTLLQAGGCSSYEVVLGDTIHISNDMAVAAKQDDDNSTALIDKGGVSSIEQQQQHAPELMTAAQKLPQIMTVSESTAAVAACVAVTQKLVNSFCNDFVGSPIHPTVVRAHKVSLTLQTHTHTLIIYAHARDLRTRQHYMLHVNIHVCQVQRRIYTKCTNIHTVGNLVDAHSL
jgi:hypothetical protein